MFIAVIRKSLFMTQEQLAESLEVARSTVGMWETGKAYPKTEMLPQIASTLGCTVDELFTGKLKE